MTSVREFCHFYYLDADHRLPCLEGCGFPDGSAKCISRLWDTDCIYPVSRRPIVPTDFTQVVKHCPGPGGCVHFRQDDYTCALKRAHKPFEFTYKFQNSLSHKFNMDFLPSGKFIMGVGIVLIVVSIVFVGGIKHHPLFTGLFVMAGSLITLIGYLLKLWEN